MAVSLHLSHVILTNIAKVSDKSKKRWEFLKKIIFFFVDQAKFFRALIFTVSVQPYVCVCLYACITF